MALYFSYDTCNVGIICVDIPPPTNVSATVVSSRSIQITWSQSPPSQPSDVTINGYLISYTVDVNYTSGGTTTVNNDSITTGMLTGLEEDTLYTITIKATTNDSNRMSSASTAVSVRTYTDSK